MSVPKYIPIELNTLELEEGVHIPQDFIDDIRIAVNFGKLYPVTPPQGVGIITQTLSKYPTVNIKDYRLILVKSSIIKDISESYYSQEFLNSEQYKNYIQNKIKHNSNYKICMIDFNSKICEKIGEGWSCYGGTFSSRTSSADGFYWEDIRYQALVMYDNNEIKLPIPTITPTIYNKYKRSFNLIRIYSPNGICPYYSKGTCRFNNTCSMIHLKKIENK